MVKRNGPASGVDLSDSHPVSGSKRSVRDRLGGNTDSSSLHGSQLNNKRYVLKNFTVVFSAFLSLALLCWCLRNCYLGNVLYILVEYNDAAVIISDAARIFTLCVYSTDKMCFVVWVNLRVTIVFNFFFLQ